jgi:phage baseplate assembly protein W
MDVTGFAFPFRFDNIGRVATLTGDDNLRARIYQVLFTSPGERVQEPEFGCGLRDLVFEPNNDILAAAAEYNIANALTRWLGDDILVQDVNTAQNGELVEVTVTYVRRDSLDVAAVKVAI